VICCECGLKYMKVRPTHTWYSKFYQNDFWQKSRLKRRKRSLNTEHLYWEEDALVTNKSEYKTVKASIKKQTWRAQRIWRIIKPFVRLTPQSKVLEIGPGFGQCLRLLSEKTGCQAMGVEPSELARSYVQECGFSLVAHTVEELRHSQEFNSQIDLVILSHVLENTSDPIENLRTLRLLLSGNGRLYIDTPNFYYYNSVNPYHLYIFSPETLKAILGLSGFGIIYQECESNPMGVRWIRSLEKARYLAAVAEKGSFIKDLELHSFPFAGVQKRGLKLVSRRQTFEALLYKINRLRDLVFKANTGKEEA
jgi:SAM-dependent methyltransferase